MIARRDRVLTRINNREVSNRGRGDVIAQTLTRTIKLRCLGGGRRVVKQGRAYLDRRARNGSPALQYAYAITKFGAESNTFDRAYPLFDAGANLE